MSLYALIVLVLLFIAGLFANFAGAGEQNLPIWVLTYVIVALPYWFSAIVVVAFVAEYVGTKMHLATIWPEEGSAQYNEELQKAGRFLKNPVRVDVYARHKGREILDIEQRLGTGELQGYVYKGRLFIDDV